ncbi:MAG: hypothetical protein DMG04_19960 [Acidobacteria bacterium]|nr:MAG: hypothetical protein DMG04_19960 [Acidobacteriota bacterium]PYQ88830.1 MAG: hypothetical protein DMG02_16475 [Acidobacteriota bacterium]PYQ90252.1 MAG: hypothetical protein DMG03_01035 [Acidobacteriota bacterium]PYR07795.1 MAG: hypothetical protein DMF99_21445 [Acidobacteriota bacterium]
MKLQNLDFRLLRQTFQKVLRIVEAFEQRDPIEAAHNQFAERLVAIVPGRLRRLRRSRCFVERCRRMWL